MNNGLTRDSVWEIVVILHIVYCRAAVENRRPSSGDVPTAVLSRSHGHLLVRARIRKTNRKKKKKHRRDEPAKTSFVADRGRRSFYFSIIRLWLRAFLLIVRAPRGQNWFSMGMPRTVRCAFITLGVLVIGQTGFRVCPARPKGRSRRPVLPRRAEHTWSSPPRRPIVFPAVSRADPGDRVCVCACVRVSLCYYVRPSRLFSSRSPGGRAAHASLQTGADRTLF